MSSQDNPSAQDGSNQKDLRLRRLSRQLHRIDERAVYEAFHALGKQHRITPSIVELLKQYSRHAWSEAAGCTKTCLLDASGAKCIPT